MDKYEKNALGTEKYKKAKKILKDTFGHNAFKTYQYQIIDSIVECKDVLAVMPTGYGKSLCFQLPPLLTNELAIVISPLIALMADQKMILDKLGMSSCCYNSTLTAKEKKTVEDGLINGDYQIMYITPESLDNCHNLINKIYFKQGICMVAIDEAHCVSSYGFDFRPKYREIVKIRTLLDNVPVLAVTATATEKVSEDIINVLKMKNCKPIKTSFDRPNLTISVKLQSQNTVDNIVDAINDTVNGSAIVYCLTKADTETMAEKLTDAGIESRAYHAGLSKDERETIQKEFMDNTYKCITATIAFGMGINKPDVRTVIHYGCPQNIDSYYQEIGRAGRDGKDASCLMFYKQKDFIIHQRFINEIRDPRYKMIRTALLHQISQYVTTNQCRRKYILKYFGQDYGDANCKKCDVCTNVKKKVNEADEFKLFQILSTVLAVKKNQHSYGMSVIELILKGSGSKKLKPWMKNLTYFGSMKSLKTKDINDFIHRAVEMGYLENRDIGDCIRVLECTQYGIVFGNEYEDKLNNIGEINGEAIGHLLRN